jgi:HAMP domain-containing protein
VREHPEFVAARQDLVQRFPWLGSLDLDLAAATFEIMMQAMEREDLRGANSLARVVYRADLASVAYVMAESVRLASRFGYDRVPEGDHFMFQMVATGGPPNLWEFGDAGPIACKLVLPVDAEDTWERWSKRALRRLRAAWTEIAAQRTAHRWAENIRLDDLHRRVEWFFRWTVQGQSLSDIGDEVGYSEYAVRRGVNQVQRLLGIQVRRGRPRKLSDLDAARICELISGFLQ